MKLTRSPRVVSPLAIWLVIGSIGACSSTDEPAPLPSVAGAGGSAAAMAGSSGAGGSIAGGGGFAGSGNAGTAPTGGSSSAGSGGGTTGGTTTGGGGGTSAGSAGTAGSAAAAGTGTGGGGNFGAELKAVAAIIQSRCASMCHGQQEGFEGRNDLRTADLGSFYSHLTSPLMSDICYGKTLVVPNKPAESLLLAVVTTKDHCALERMPPNCEGDACVPASDIQKIEAWIAAGAPKN